MKMLIAAKPCSLVEFYDSIAREMGYEHTSDLQYDCRKVNIAPNIQDNFYTYYTRLAMETEPQLSDNDIKVGITMTLAMSGPKVDDTLKANEVEIFDGFIVETVQN